MVGLLLSLLSFSGYAPHIPQNSVISDSNGWMEGEKDGQIVGGWWGDNTWGGEMNDRWVSSK